MRKKRSNIDFYAVTGENVRKKRNELNLTQEQLGNLIEVESSYISKIEHGRDRLSAATFYELSKALDTPMDYLAGEGRDAYTSSSLDMLIRKLLSMSEIECSMVLDYIVYMENQRNKQMNMEKYKEDPKMQELRKWYRDKWN